MNIFKNPLVSPITDPFSSPLIPGPHEIQCRPGNAVGLVHRSGQQSAPRDPERQTDVRRHRGWNAHQDGALVQPQRRFDGIFTREQSPQTNRRYVGWVC